MTTKNLFACFMVTLVSTALSATSHAAVMNLPGLTNVKVWEVTGPPIDYSFNPAGPELTAQLGVGVLGFFNNDLITTANEYYDVFYSDASGNFNINGNYLTVEAVYTGSSSGLNVAAVDLVFADGTICRADILASFLGLGASYLPGSELLAVDPDTPTPSTWTNMGQTATPTSQHLRVTVGWSKIPEPGALVLGCIGLIGVLAQRRKR